MGNEPAYSPCPLTGVAIPVCKEKHPADFSFRHRREVDALLYFTWTERFKPHRLTNLDRESCAIYLTALAVAKRWVENRSAVPYKPRVIRRIQVASVYVELINADCFQGAPLSGHEKTKAVEVVAYIMNDEDGNRFESASKLDAHLVRALIAGLRDVHSFVPTKNRISRIKRLKRAARVSQSPDSQ